MNMASSWLSYDMRGYGASAGFFEQDIWIKTIKDDHGASSELGPGNTGLP